MAIVTTDEVREILTRVVDPELHMNIVELGLVYKIDLIDPQAPVAESAENAEDAAPAGIAPTEAVVEPVADSGTETAPEVAPATGATTPDVEVEMTLTSPGCPYGPMIMGQVPSVLKEHFQEQIGEVSVSLTFSPPWDPATMASEDVKFELGIF